jgi:hypothetical protein
MGTEFGDKALKALDEAKVDFGDAKTETQKALASAIVFALLEVARAVRSKGSQLFESTPMDFSEALGWLAARGGQRAVVLITGPVDEDSPTILRVDAPLGPMETVDEGQALSDETVATASFRVGDALISMFGREFERAENFSDAMVVVHQRHATFEWRVGG